MSKKWKYFTCPRVFIPLQVRLFMVVFWAHISVRFLYCWDWLPAGACSVEAAAAAATQPQDKRCGQQLRVVSEAEHSTAQPICDAHYLISPLRVQCGHSLTSIRQEALVKTTICEIILSLTFGQRFLWQIFVFTFAQIVKNRPKSIFKCFTDHTDDTTTSRRDGNSLCSFVVLIINRTLETRIWTIPKLYVIIILLRLVWCYLNSSVLSVLLNTQSCTMIQKPWEFNAWNHVK